MRLGFLFFARLLFFGFVGLFFVEWKNLFDWVNVAVAVEHAATQTTETSRKMEDGTQFSCESRLIET